jgi:hypothetical protein
MGGTGRRGGPGAVGPPSVAEHAARPAVLGRANCFRRGLLDDGEVVATGPVPHHAGMLEHGEPWFVLATRATRWGSSRATIVQSIAL